MAAGPQKGTTRNDRSNKIKEGSRIASEKRERGTKHKVHYAGGDEKTAEGTECMPLLRQKSRLHL